MWYFFLEAFFLPVFLLIWSGSGVEKSLGTANINTRRNKLNQHIAGSKTLQQARGSLSV